MTSGASLIWANVGDTPTGGGSVSVLVGADGESSWGNENDQFA